jgi:DNA-binding transcriptional ArsR family regulator
MNKSSVIQTEHVAELFSILGDQTRVKIVNALIEKELCVHELAELLNMTLSAISHQLRLLKATRLVRFRKEGKHVYYRLDDQHIRQLLNIALEHVKETR